MGRNTIHPGADATVLTSYDYDEQVARELLSRFKSRHPDGLTFAMMNRVLLLEATNGVGLDVALGALEFEARAIQRSSFWEIAQGHSLRTCSAEDLIVHKAFASREKDWMDINGILQRQGAAIKSFLIMEELRPLAELKGDISISERLEALFKKHGLKL